MRNHDKSSLLREFSPLHVLVLLPLALSLFGIVSHLILKQSIFVTPFIQFNPQNAIQVAVDFKETPYSGGSNITFKGKLGGSDDFKARLFRGDLLLGDLPLHLTFSVKSEPNSLLGLHFEYYSTYEERKTVLVAPHVGNHLSGKFNQVIETSRVVNQATSRGWVVQESSIAVKGNKLTEIGVVCYRPGHEISSDTSADDYYAVLGHISIKNSAQSPNFPHSSSWLVDAQHVKWTPSSEGVETVGVQINWKLKEGNDSEFSRFNVYAEKIAEKVVADQEPARQFIGVARVESFYVNGFAISSDVSGVKFIVQVCGTDGSSQKLDDSPFLRLDKPKDQ